MTTREHVSACLAHTLHTLSLPGLDEMWLINIDTRQVEEFIGLEIPKYAILSHTWVAGQEVTFQEMRSCGSQNPSASPSKTGWEKIAWTCQLAKRDGIQYAWVDTCCIDKSSSAELSEAINSMFRWYKHATVCYAYLADLAPIALNARSEQLQSRIQYCRWFTRSWTLQELIAPSHIEFYDRDWRGCFTKASASTVLAKITGIGVDILEHVKDLSLVPVAQKMSWAASRRATRIEDTAYSLLGIFGINMPMLYGEEHKAFFRLQAEIIGSCHDRTIFAWTSPSRGAESQASNPAPKFSGVMALSPREFQGCGEVQESWDQSSFDFSLANRGIKLRAQFRLSRSLGFDNYVGHHLVLPVCQLHDKVYGIQMRNVGEGCFIRQNAGSLVLVRPWEGLHRLMLAPYLLTQIPPSDVSGPAPEDTIMRSRVEVLEIVLARGMEIYRRWPWQQWDEPDRLFFRGAPASEQGIGWAGLKIVCSPSEPFVELLSSVDFLFYAFGWARGTEPGCRPRCTIHEVQGAIADRALESMNDEAVRDGWDPYWVANRLVGTRIPETSFLVAGEAGEQTLLITCTTERVEDLRISVKSFWRVVFDWEIVPTREVPPAPNRGWNNINWGGVWNEL